MRGRTKRLGATLKEIAKGLAARRQPSIDRTEFGFFGRRQDLANAFQFKRQCPLTVLVLGSLWVLKALLEFTILDPFRSRKFVLKDDATAYVEPASPVKFVESAPVGLKRHAIDRLGHLSSIARDARGLRWTKGAAARAA